MPVAGDTVAALQEQRGAERATLKILEHTLAHLESEAALAPHPPAKLAREISETETQIKTQRQALKKVAETEKTVRASDQGKNGTNPPTAQHAAARKNGAS